MQIVQKRDAATLTEIINSNVVKGTTIYSDMWKAYDNLENVGLPHDTVNHIKKFKSATRCCTNAVEDPWGLAKLRIKKMCV